VLPQRSCVRLPPETNKQASKNKDKTMSEDQGFEKFKSRFAAFCGRFVHFCCLIKHDFFFSSIVIRKFVEGQKSDHFCVFAFIIKRSL